MGFTAIAVEGIALGLLSPIPHMGEDPTLFPSALWHSSIIAVARSNTCRWEVLGTPFISSVFLSYSRDTII